jgi:hypothetical protein
MSDLQLILNCKVDSRVKGSAGNPVKTDTTGLMQRTYCIQCTRPMGWVSMDTANFISAQNVVCICDDCISFMGEPPLQKAKVQEVQVKEIKQLKEV